MKHLVSSRLLGVESEHSDYDYVEIVENGGGFYRHFVNIALSPNSHCFYFNRAYREKVARFEMEHADDYKFIFNAEDYLAGVITINPFDYLEIWKEKLHSIDFRDPYLYNHRRGSYQKRFYHLIYNIECIKEGTFTVSESARARIKRFHDFLATEEEYQSAINELKNI